MPRPLPIPPTRDDPAALRLTTPDDESAPLPQELLTVVAAFDGQRDASGVLEHLTAQGEACPPETLAAIVRQLDEQDQLGAPEWQALPILSLPGARHTCLACGDCCHRLVIGPLDDRDLERLGALDLEPLGVALDEAVVIHETAAGPQRFLDKREGACVYLQRDSGRCAIHAAHGLEVKALACQAFPLRLVFVPGGMRLSLSPGCIKRHATQESGELLDETRARVLLDLGLGQSSPFPRWALYLPDEAGVPLMLGLALPFDQYTQLEQRLLDELEARPQGSVEATLADLLRWLHGIVADNLPPDALPIAGDDARAAQSLKHFCSLLAPIAAQTDPALAAAVERLTRHLDGDSVEAMPDEVGADAEEIQALAADLLRNEIWALELLRTAGAILPGLVLLAFHQTLARWLALELAGKARISPAIFNLAFARVDSLLKRLDLGLPGALIAFCAAPLMV